MKRIVLFVTVLILYGCKETSISKEDISFLNGYWEITEVEFPDGNKKNYTVNPSVDFIQVENMEGFRKKLQPSLNGTYTTSNDVESFKIVTVNEAFTIQYKKDRNEWEEKLVHLDSMSFSVLNTEGKTYSYKRFQPITIPK
ncbi:hypothetical protein LV716_13550 [Flagellimonas sp. HMM57]|uniref:hypothetical protein n=1 Tax=unclassified Flagellimonas TaxID=2644544 RepID=UPI0013D4419C|nr:MULTISPECIES: hypothetical protein [unclassified Flagellimonas]UII75274.1 hypothetical protein LV716_13550 [Flagellimonas sp. HMM57]